MGHISCPMCSQTLLISNGNSFAQTLAVETGLGSTLLYQRACPNMEISTATSMDVALFLASRICGPHQAGLCQMPSLRIIHVISQCFTLASLISTKIKSPGFSRTPKKLSQLARQEATNQWLNCCTCRIYPTFTMCSPKPRKQLLHSLLCSRPKSLSRRYRTLIDLKLIVTRVATPF